MKIRSGLATLVLLAALAAGCVSVDYVGKSYPPTASVDLYMSPADVKRPYEVIGEARAQVEALPFSSPAEQLQEKLLAEARSRGANAVILGSITSRQVASTSTTTGQATSKKKGNKKNTQYTDTTTTNVEEVNELRGTLIRFTD
ncbi:hypothetical protein K2Z84_12500 [Candidatus Binatia bacterium]|jgi:hypothetical protein|nr:hypothetical protein [Candidatus Binatia bacterium]